MHKFMTICAHILLTTLCLGSIGILCGCQRTNETPIVTSANDAATESPSEQVNTPPEDFTWSDLPMLDEIPDGNITGMLNGKAFKAQTVRIRKTETGSVLEIFDVGVAVQTGVPSNDTGVNLRFNIKPGQHGQLSKAFEDDIDLDTAHALYWYPKGDGETPVTVNASWACALEITDWSLQARDDNPDIIGNVKGKVALTFDDEAGSWIAGTFDAVYYTW